MPWIKCVPPVEVEGLVKGLIPDANVWIVPDDADVVVDAKIENES
jgi:hypothetical protein